MNTKNIIFRIDLSKEIGGGHLSRSLTQVEYLSKKGIGCKLILKGQEEIKYAHLDVLRLPESLNYDDEVKYLIQKNIQAELCVFDFVGEHNLPIKNNVRELIQDYYKLVSKIAFFDGVGIGSIYESPEDFAKVDLLIRPYATALELTTPKLLSGFKYYIYPNEYYRLVNFKKIGPENFSFTISFGRADPNNLTEKVLAAFDNFNFFSARKVTVVIGDMFSQERVEKIRVKYLNRASLAIHPDSLKQYFDESNVIICGTGLTKYEACLFQSVVIVCSGSGADFDLQEQFQKLGLSYHVGPIMAKSHLEVGKELNFFISDPSGIRNKHLVAGHGLALICNKYLEILI